MKVVIERGRTAGFEELPPWSIALDGYVQGPAFDNERHRYSFDHHKGCFRLITKATCEQVRDAVLLGLDPGRFTVYVNDVDMDTALAVWVLRHASRLAEPAVSALVTEAGLLDAHGGGFPLPALREHVEWIGEPERRARLAGDYEQLSTDGLQALLDAIGERVDRYLAGEAPSAEALRALERPPDFSVMRQGAGWSLVQASDPHVFADLYRMGFERLVTVKPQSDGSWAYTVAKKSEFVGDFDVPAILSALNAVEPGWGGGSTIGGAPRHPDGTRSRLAPDDVFAIVEGCVLGAPVEPAVEIKDGGRRPRRRGASRAGRPRPRGGSRTRP